MEAISKRQPRRGGSLIGVAALAAICAVLAAGCGSSQSSRSRSGTPAASAAAATGDASTPIPNASALEGTWRTGSLTVADMTAVLSHAGLQEWIQPFRTKAGLGHANVFLLTIANGVWHEGWSIDGGPFVDNDDGLYHIVGDTVVITALTGGPVRNTYRWSVQGGTLRLTFVGDTDGPFKGIPDQAYQRAFYTAAPFQRQR
jgi:hypothetical protein